MMKTNRVLSVLGFILLICTLAFVYGCSESGGPQFGTANGSFRSSNPLTEDDVRLIIQQAVTEAVNQGVAVAVVVTDRGGNVLGVFEMTGTSDTTVLGSQNPDNILMVPAADRGLELIGLNLPGVVENPPFPPALAAISKAGAASLFSTSGNAFSTLTTSHAIQEHRPPGVSFVPSGPVFGIQFSNLPCSDITTNSPLPIGLAADPGGLPLYKDGEAVGAIGVEGVLETYTVQGMQVTTPRYALAPPAFGDDMPIEEIIAAAGTRGFEAPGFIRADTVLLDGFRLPFINVDPAPLPLIPFGDLPGSVIPLVIPAFTFFDGTIRATPDPAYGFGDSMLAGFPVRIAVDDMGVNRFPITGSMSGGLTAADVETILSQGVLRAYQTRSAIRQPAGSVAQVNINVVDENGVVLGYVGLPDAPFEGFDASIQKGRTAAFFANPNAGGNLNAAGFADYTQAAADDGLFLDGSIAFSSRAIAFLSVPFYPDGIDGTPNGPFSKDFSTIWSPFNDGLQLDLLLDNLLGILSGGPLTDYTNITGIESGIAIFAGSFPLYNNGVFVGAIGVSGDGINENDIVGFEGTIGFEPPEGMRSDDVIVRGARLPYARFPRNPDISE